MAWVLAGPAAAQDQYELADGQWQAVERLEPQSPEGRLQTIRKAIVEGRADEAVELADAWIEQYPNHPELVEAYLLRGDAQVARGHYYKSLFDYERVIRLYPASEQFVTAMEREYEIARLFTTGVKRRFLGMRLLPAEGEGEELFILIQERAPGSQLGERASLALADFYYRNREWKLAADAYDLFMQNYPESLHTEWAMIRLIHANLAGFRGPWFDPTGLLDAGQRLRSFRERFPAAAERIDVDELLHRIDEAMARKSLITAAWYQRRGEDISAVFLYRRLIEEYPTTAAAREAIERMRELGAAASEPPDGALPVSRTGRDASQTPALPPAEPSSPPEPQPEAAP